MADEHALILARNGAASPPSVGGRRPEQKPLGDLLSRMIVRQCFVFGCYPLVTPKALAAVKLFCQAVEQETATAALGRQILRFLERARHDPGLRFEAGLQGRPAV